MTSDEMCFSFRSMAFEGNSFSEVALCCQGLKNKDSHSLQLEGGPVGVSL